MKQIVISILKTIFKIIKAVLCVAGVMAVILSLEVTKNIIKDKENGDTNDSQEISIEVSGKIPVQQVEQENDNNKQHYATLQEASQHTEVFTEEGGEYDTQIEHIIAVFENSKEVIAAYQSAKSPKQMHVYEELAHFQISKEDEKRKYLHVRSHTKDYYIPLETTREVFEAIVSYIVMIGMYIATWVAVVGEKTFYLKYQDGKYSYHHWFRKEKTFELDERITYKAREDGIVIYQDNKRLFLTSHGYTNAEFFGRTLLEKNIKCIKGEQYMEKYRDKGQEEI